MPEFHQGELSSNGPGFQNQSVKEEPLLTAEGADKADPRPHKLHSPSCSTRQWSALSASFGERLPGEGGEVNASQVGGPKRHA